jgi:hypothetical protein
MAEEGSRPSVLVDTSVFVGLEQGRLRGNTPSAGAEEPRVGWADIRHRPSPVKWLASQSLRFWNRDAVTPASVVVGLHTGAGHRDGLK